MNSEMTSKEELLLPLLLPPSAREKPLRKSLRNADINYRSGWFRAPMQAEHNQPIFGVDWEGGLKKCFAERRKRGVNLGHGGRRGMRCQEQICRRIFPPMDGRGRRGGAV